MRYNLNMYTPNYRLSDRYLILTNNYGRSMKFSTILFFSLEDSTWESFQIVKLAPKTNTRQTPVAKCRVSGLLGCHTRLRIHSGKSRVSTNSTRISQNNRVSGVKRVHNPDCEMGIYMRCGMGLDTIKTINLGSLQSNS